MDPSVSLVLSIASQIPVVAAFIYFVLRSNKDWREAMEKMDATGRNFITNLEKQQNQYMERIADSIDIMSNNLRELGAMLSRHDATVRGVNSQTVGSHDEIQNHLDKMESPQKRRRPNDPKDS